MRDDAGAYLAPSQHAILSVREKKDCVLSRPSVLCLKEASPSHSSSKGSCLSCQPVVFYIVPCAMESVQQQSSLRWVLHNTFLEVVDDASDSDGCSSFLMRANSDSVLYEGYSRRQAAEQSEQETKSGKASEGAPTCSGESTESELDSWSDAETTPDTMEGRQSFPLPCYHHIADSPSGRSTPCAVGEYVAQTPSPRCMDWPATSFGDAGLPTEEIRSDPMPDLVPPTHGRAPEAHSGGGRDVSRHALQRLMAEVAKLEQENELLRRMARSPVWSGPGTPSRTKSPIAEHAPSVGDRENVRDVLHDASTQIARVLPIPRVKYNFLYLPIDFRTPDCMGYAFVNLVDPTYVPDFWAKFSGYSNWVVRSKKLCGVSWSEPHQGLESHVERYRNSPIMHESVPDDYRPIVLQNGVRVAFPEPSKSSRPPRNRHHTSIQVEGKAAGSRHRRQASADAPRDAFRTFSEPTSRLKQVSSEVTRTKISH